MSQGWHPDIDYRAYAQDFHRRAQKAEANLLRSAEYAASLARRHARLVGAYHELIKNRDTLKRRIKTVQKRNRDLRMRLDPLTRIIELGKEFP